MTYRVAVLALAFVLACGIGRHEAPSQEAPSRGLHRGVRTELFLGRVGPDGGIVDDEAWRAFLADVVTPRFPAGFTVIEAAGQYRNGAGSEVTRERSEVLVVVHEGDERAEAALREIVEVYKQRFGQRAVLRVDGAAMVGF